jgi:glutathione S-transferase
MLNERTGPLEDKLSTGEFLIGDHLTAGDVACAAGLYLADLTDEQGASHPISTFFHTNMHLGEGREKTRAWMRRVIAYDAIMGAR